MTSPAAGASRPTIIAYMGEGPGYWPLVERSLQISEARQARLIFYDVDAVSMFSNALPTWWSADGLKEQFGNRLGPEELEKAGRQDILDHVVHARARGVDAYGWLPSKRDVNALAEYATEQGASLLVVPKQLERHGLVGWLQGRPTSDQLDNDTDQAVLEVDLEPAAAKA